jgi:hypothetical protein
MRPRSRPPKSSRRRNERKQPSVNQPNNRLMPMHKPTKLKRYDNSVRSSF